MPYNDLTGQASGHRTIKVALNDVVTCSADLPKRMVGPVGLEPTTYGLKERSKPAWNARDRSFRAWLIDAG